MSLPQSEDISSRRVVERRLGRRRSRRLQQRGRGAARAWIGAARGSGGRRKRTVKMGMCSASRDVRLPKKEMEPALIFFPTHNLPPARTGASHKGHSTTCHFQQTRYKYTVVDLIGPNRAGSRTRRRRWCPRSRCRARPSAGSSRCRQANTSNTSARAAGVAKPWMRRLCGGPSPARRLIRRSTHGRGQSPKVEAGEYTTPHFKALDASMQRWDDASP